MKRIIGVLVASVVGLVCTTLGSSQRVDAQAPEYVASYYASGPQQVTISKNGQQLAVLETPAGVELGVQLIKGEFKSPNENGGQAAFIGDVSIRTRSRSELTPGTASRAFMMNAPLRLDLQEAQVTVQKK